MNDTAQKKILLVDDEKHLLISLRDYLSFEKFDVTIAQSGEEALEKLKTFTPDLIILDISMPGMGGLGFLKHISSSDGKPEYPVLVLTARSMMADFFGNLDIDGFAAKPCDETELVKKIRGIMAKRSSVFEKQQRTIKRLIIAEDDENTSRQFVTAFESAGYFVTIAASGPEALEKSATEKPDILIMKEILPKLNGSAVAALIEVMPSISSTPVIIYDTASMSNDGSPTKFGRLKCVRKLIPTSEINQLLAAVNEILG